MAEVRDARKNERHVCGRRRDGEPAVSSVAHRSAEAAASWWHPLSEDAVSEARAAASSGAKRSRSVREVHAALSSSGGTVATWQFLLEVDDFRFFDPPVSPKVWLCSNFI